MSEVPCLMSEVPCLMREVFFFMSHGRPKQMSHPNFVFFWCLEDGPQALPSTKIQQQQDLAGRHTNASRRALSS